jgi:protein-tyrosine kinase
MMRDGIQAARERSCLEGMPQLGARADLRRPVQHETLGVSRGRGLCDAMLDPDADIRQDATIEHLSLLTTGKLSANPSEILASERFGRIIKTLKGRMDIILFDSPSVLFVTDAAILGTRVDRVLCGNYESALLQTYKGEGYCEAYPPYLPS